ncbi:unnamed protein product [Tetraodon nigroviridis]|uniref:(spotted green pufferfish) hypothetical protein n=1 Tax=Tetraodon nigroviridis TaxID=99883 RepID=Q4RZQ4_TETNG|nr:unnamed protein product [Tetraodon nigroviridis]
MAQKISDAMNELKENESFRYVVETLHLLFNIPQDSADLEEKIIMLQKKYEEIASANQQKTTEEILTELVALKEKLESQDQNQHEFTSWKEESTSAIMSMKEALEMLQQENTAALKDEIKKLQHEHTSLREQSESRISSMKEEVEKLQLEHTSALKEEIEKLQKESSSALKDELDKLRQENTSLKEEMGKLRQDPDAALGEKMEDKEMDSQEENQAFKEEIEMFSEEFLRLRRDITELRSSTESQESLIDTLAQERQVHLEQMKQQTDILSELKSTDEHHQSQLDSLRTMLENKSVSSFQEDDDGRTADGRTADSRSDPVESEKNAMVPAQKISDIHYHLLRYTVEDGKVTWTTEEALAKSDGSQPD